MQANAEVEREMVEGELEQCLKSNVEIRRRAEAAELRLAQAGLLTVEASVASLSAVQVLQIQYGAAGVCTTSATTIC